MLGEVLFLHLVLAPVRILEQVLQHDHRLLRAASLLSLRELAFEATEAEFEVGGGHAGEGVVEVATAAAAILETRSPGTGSPHPNTLARFLVQLSHPFLIQRHLLRLFPPLLLRLDQLFPRAFEIELEAVHLALQRGRFGLERVDFGFVRVEEGLVRCGFGVVVFESGVPVQQVGVLLFEGLWDGDRTTKASVEITSPTGLPADIYQSLYAHLEHPFGLGRFLEFLLVLFNHVLLLLGSLARVPVLVHLVFEPSRFFSTRSEVLYLLLLTWEGRVSSAREEEATSSD